MFTMKLDKKYYKVIAISLIIGILMTLSAQKIGDNFGYHTYSCDKDTVPDMKCFKLSNFNDKGIQSECFYDKNEPLKHKICPSGWEVVYFMKLK